MNKYFNPTRKTFIVLGLALILLVASATWALAQSGGVIYACVLKDGTLYIVPDAGQCKKNETLLSWNIMGPQGNPGLACWDLNGDSLQDANEDINLDDAWDAADCKGAQGAQGEPGVAGLDGQTGPQGPAGANGAVGPAGPQGEPGNLALAGQSCPTYQYLIGFDAEGNILCADTRPGFYPVAQNADWTPITQEFNGVLMALVPSGCLGTTCFDTPFWMDVYEVTNAQYGSAGYFGGPDKPRETITWYDAKAFCEARGARLPDEWEWEYAARGPDLLVYPWGNTFVDANAVYTNNNCGGTCDVGSRPGGVSWVGAQDMAGNVLEWMENDYDSTNKVMRGGSWYLSDYAARAAVRPWLDPTYAYDSIGFRCARSH